MGWSLRTDADYASTAAHLGLPMSSLIHEPEANVAAAARYMAELRGISLT